MNYLLNDSIARIKRILIVFVASLLAVISFNIKPIYGDDITYIEAPWVYLIENNEVIIIGYVGSDEECVVPWTLGGLEIKEIRQIQNKNVTKVVVPNNGVEVNPDLNETYEISYYIIDEQGENKIVDPNAKTGNPISNFFSKLFGSNKKDEKQENNKSTETNDNVVNNNESVTNNNTDTSNNNNQIGDPFDLMSNTTNNTQEVNNTTKDSNGSLTIIVIIAVVLIVAVIFFFTRKTKDGINSSRTARGFKRKIRRIFNKFK